jgi:alpha-L-fucosidase
MEPFQPSIESLKRYSAPEWYKDLKFGIYCHWGLQSVQGFDGWYARHMYVEGQRTYKHHVKTYGHPSEFGLKDFIPLWKAENFNPDEMCRIFKEAGAKFFTPVAVHHDNFDLWDSKHTKWNSVNMGPKKDIIGLFKKAAEKNGLKFGVTTHLSRSYSWLQVSHHSDKEGPKAGVPYDGANPEFKDFYCETHDDDNPSSPINPSPEWKQHWIDRMKDLIDNYHPEFFYFDAALPFAGEDKGKSGMEVISHFYNDNLKQSNGQSHGMLTFKKIPDHGINVSGISTIDHEVHFPDDMVQEYWQTDVTLVGGWFYNKSARYRPYKSLISELIKVVSFNGNMLLNVPPLPDGSLDKGTINALTKIGAWLKKNGDGIYDTRPWTTPRENKIYFTQKKGDIFAFNLGKLKKNLKVEALGSKKFGRKINSVKCLSTQEELEFNLDESYIRVNIPKHIRKEFIPCLKFS